MKIRYLILCIVIALGLAISCNTIEPPVDMGYNYIPIDTGRYYIYDVDSIYIECAVGLNDTTNYQIKETYPSTFLDANGVIALNVTRYYRSDSTQAWALMTPDVWWLQRTTTRLEKSEENLRIVKMTYPIDENYTWNGNAYNILPAQDYTYGQNDISFNNGFEIFDSTITVYQKEDTGNLIQYYLFTETYARNVGMVHKQKFNIQEAIIYDSNDAAPPLGSCWELIPPPMFWYQIPILQRIKKGSIVIYKLIDHGFE